MPAVAEQLELERTVLSLTFLKVSDKKQAMKASILVPHLLLHDLILIFIILAMSSWIS